MIEDLAKGELSKEEYPYMREPSAAVLRSMTSDNVSLQTSASNSKPAQSMRTSKPVSTWASKLRPSEDGCSRHVNICKFQLLGKFDSLCISVNHHQ